MNRLADAVLLARLVEELLPDSWEEAAQLCSSALDGTFDVEAAKARLRELRPIRDPDDELDRLAPLSKPVVRRRAEVLLRRDDHRVGDAGLELDDLGALDHREGVGRAANAKMGWDLQILVLEGKAMCVSFVQKAELPSTFKPEPN